jgi:hypothetical protein
VSEQIEKRIGSLEDCIIGTTEKPGVLEMLRKQQETSTWMREKMTSMSNSLDELKADKQKVRGIIAGASAVGGLLGYIASWLGGKN